jgi:hypothetical protein
MSSLLDLSLSGPISLMLSHGSGIYTWAQLRRPYAWEKPGPAADCQAD